MPRSYRPGRRLGIDIGGTKVAVGLVDVGPGQDSLRLLGWTRRAAGPALAAPAMVDNILDQAESLLKDLGEDVRQLVAVGVGFPGDFEVGGPVRTAPNLPAFVGTSPSVLFGDALRERFGLEVPLAVGNDACLAALAEARLGAGRGADRLLYLTVSTGVGGARFDRSAAGGARTVNIEPGLSVHPDPEQPDLTLEYLASGTAIARIVRREIRAEIEAGGEGAERHWAEFLDRLDVAGSPFEIDRRIDRLTARHLGQAAANGDPFSQRHFERAADLIAHGLVRLLEQGFGEQRIVIGGSVAEKVPGFLDRVRRTLSDLRVRDDAPAGLRALDVERDLVATELGEERGILGAVLLVEDAV